MYPDRTEAGATANVLTDIVSQIGRILRKEAALAKAEMGENLSRAGVAIGLIVAAALLALVAFIALAGAGVAALVAYFGWAVHWAALAVGGGIALIAIIFAAKGIYDLKPKRLVPSRSIANVKQDVALMKERINA